jgi:hypothetical protein
MFIGKVAVEGSLTSTHEVIPNNVINQRTTEEDL